MLKHIPLMNTSAAESLSFFISLGWKKKKENKELFFFIRRSFSEQARKPQVSLPEESFCAELIAD